MPRLLLFQIVALPGAAIGVDALAQEVIKHNGSECYICEDVNPEADCTRDNADFVLICNDNERASCVGEIGCADPFAI
jgi:hypothetical protein